MQLIFVLNNKKEEKRKMEKKRFRIDDVSGRGCGTGDVDKQSWLLT